MTFWQVLVLIITTSICMLTFSYSGFYFGWMAKRGSPPASIPIISNIVDAITKKDKEEDEVPKSFFS